MRVAYKEFSGVFKTTQGLFDQAAKFASTLDPERVISISHSSHRWIDHVTVWYWTG